jgi:O-methyltransferase
VLRRFAERALDARDLQLQPKPGSAPLRKTHPDVEPAFAEVSSACAPYTMTSIERRYALWQGVRHVHRAGIRGHLVECGVWRGGSAMLAAMTLLQLGDPERHIHLYDTFEGMPPPGEHDVDASGARMVDEWDRHERQIDDPVFAYGAYDDVLRNMASTGYPSDRIHLVKGKVEDTIPAEAPDEIAVLRLDTDWYESTRHELAHLWPRLVDGGVLIVDDYGHWAGARQAVDEYFQERSDAPLMHRIDYTGRIGVKPSTASD